MFKQTAEQVAVIDAVKTGGNVNIQALAGSGKAQPVWSIVKTPFGDKAIGDLKVGDSIFRKDGNIGKVVGVYPQGVQPYSKVTFRDGSHTYCNKDHLWTVYNLSSKKKGSTKTVPLSYFIDKGLTAHGNMRFKIQMCSPCQYPEKQYYIHPYVLGVLIGDGSMVGSTPCCSFGEKDKEIINHFSNLLPEGYAMTLRYTSDNCQQATLFHSELKGKSNPLHDEVGRLGLKVKSGRKFIPAEYKHGSVSQRLHLLRGLMDSDGSCRLNRTTFCSTSRQLIEDVKELVASLGGTCIETSEYVKDTSVTFNLNVKMIMNPFLVDSKASKWSYSYKNPPSRYIVAIEDAGECEQVCIKVDAEDSLYLTDSYIVTHNTTTMSAVSEAIPTKSCLYMAFNKAIADDAVGKMYNNTTCRTMHSVAYTGVSRELTAKLRHPRILPKDLAKNYNLAAIGIDGRTLSAGMQMSAINNAINTWCNSAEDQVTSKDVVLPEWIEKHDAAYIAEQLAKTAREHWTQLLSPNNKLPISHDVYLKRWALGQPKLPFDVLFLDECQDVSGVILEVVKQQNAQIIAVGDIYQNIYSWKGTVNAMQLLNGTTRGLSQSFRFGEAIASYADNILSMLGNSTPLRGFESVSSTIGTVVAPDAILCRTNAGCVSELIANIGNNDGRRYSLNVNMSEIKAFINAVKQVKRFGKTEHFVLSAFTSYNELLEYCKDNPKDTEITGTIALVQKFGEDKLLTIIEQASNVHRADCVITTAHKAKGLEWNKVKINNDFNLNVDKRGRLNVSEAELRLIYVAVTRAKLELDTTGLMLLNR